MTHNQFDVIGVGIGPFNLGLAALVDGVSDVQAIFFEQQTEFNWHPGMLLDGTTLQVPFMADLVTMADPKNPYSYLEYLHEHNRLYPFYFYEHFHIPRKEYNHYCKWAASKLSSCRFGKRVETVEKAEGHWVVHVRDQNTLKWETYETKNLVMGVGTNPSYPDVSGLTPSKDIFHTAQFKQNKENIKQASAVTVIGSGQSAGEVVYEILKNKPSSQTLHWLTRSRGFFPMEYSKLGLEHFSPDYTDYFYSLPQKQKDELLPRQDLLYKGMSVETIADIYDLLYEQTIGGEKANVYLKPISELEKVTNHASHYTLTFRQWEKNETFSIDTDTLILGTGYTPAFPPCLERVKQYMELDDKERFVVSRNYEICLRSSTNSGERLFVQNGEIHTHGPGAPDLGLGAYRNAVIINEITGRELFSINDHNVFQQFG
ncbi:lysine N6-hydroxylase [Alteribacillus persepolensis]|uniref:L-lysine N6-monooxygenase MbtG n=1 Tax=Alteribacillus persepolensis TaxID=568899 RepID=A0A1G8FNP3_9BACI|nr:lysine N(6)-hydroxylase/L-ornithine N(5)-oxygenase family protein [Alteribacillus persepolensis]SDH83699.1 lysine N6-hydroxylase [Alteribacillus persepolensis]